MELKAKITWTRGLTEEGSNLSGALSVFLGTIAALKFWPGDKVRAYSGPLAVYVRLNFDRSGFHVIAVEGGCQDQLAPPEALKKL